MEILSPAGSREALIAAVQSGADAVYLGFGAFNARRNARNFTDEEFLAAVSYCHLRGVKVYLTLNTLLTDRELPQAAETARYASRCGVDAILVQDWGVLQMLRQAAPDVPVHASTQMSLHTLSGVKEAERLSLTRAVLARELSREDIRGICAEAPIEIETFIHGALCMCYSGQCAMSALIGGRSGNRGTCAQPCRLPYGVNAPAKGHPLSLKDACLAQYVQELEEMGVACLKLEGRMKRPEYVAVITDIYARLLKEKRKPTKAELQDLSDAFSRSGFTQDYYFGKKGPQMFGTRPENAPEPKELFQRARSLYEKEDRRTAPVSFHAVLAENTPLLLTAEDELGHCVTVEGPIPEPARSRDLTEDELCQRLSKTGGTAFRCESVSAQVQPGLSLPASAINQLRRDALEQLSAARTEIPPRRERDFVPAALEEDCSCQKPELTVSLYKKEQLTQELLDLEPAIVYIPLEWAEELPSLRLSPKTELCAVLPRIWRDGDEETFARWLKMAREKGVGAVALHNLGHLPLARESGLTLRGDFGLNLFNSEALHFWKTEGLASATVSFELRMEQIRDLRKHVPCEAIVYGRLPLMLMENCVISNNVGCNCQKENDLIDRKGVRFPLLPAFGCRNEIQNSKTLFLADKPDYTRLGLRYARLRFTTETPQQCLQVLRRYRGESDWMPEEYTRGLFYRGVD